MRDFNTKVVRPTNGTERAIVDFGVAQRNERGDTLVEWATSREFNIMNAHFQKKAGRRWARRSPYRHIKLKCTTY